MSIQNDVMRVKDLLQQGTITTDEANVKLVQAEIVRLITNSVSANVRKVLNAAVKAGQLGHIKKEGYKPEAYHHINGRARALELREEKEREVLNFSRSAYFI